MCADVVSAVSRRGSLVQRLRVFFSVRVATLGTSFLKRIVGRFPADLRLFARGFELFSSPQRRACNWGVWRCSDSHFAFRRRLICAPSWTDAPWPQFGSGIRIRLLPPPVAMSTGCVFRAEATSYLGRDGGFLFIIRGVQIFFNLARGGRRRVRAVSLSRAMAIWAGAPNS